MTATQVNWEAHFLPEHIKLTQPIDGVEHQYVECSMATADGLGMKVHHKVFLKKLVTTDEEAQLYFKQLMLVYGDRIRKITESLHYDYWDIDQNHSDRLGLELNALTSINNILSPANALYPPDRPHSPLSPWLTKYYSLVFNNAFVQAARHTGLPPQAQFWTIL